MAATSVSTITSASPERWEDAILRSFARARHAGRPGPGKRVEGGQTTEYRVTLQVAFVLEDSDE